MPRVLSVVVVSLPCMWKARPMSDHQTPAEREAAILEALGLARSMIACGEQMTPQAEAVFDRATVAAHPVQVERAREVAGGALAWIALNVDSAPEESAWQGRAIVEQGRKWLADEDAARLPERPDEEEDAQDLQTALTLIRQLVAFEKPPDLEALEFVERVQPRLAARALRPVAARSQRAMRELPRTRQ
jgi:hypothetical protein